MRVSFLSVHLLARRRVRSTNATNTSTQGVTPFFLMLLLAWFTVHPNCPALAAGNATSSRTVSGRVKDSLGRPIANAVVTLRASDGRTVAHALSGAHGTFELRVNESGVYDLVVKKRGFADASRVAVLHDQSKVALDLVMEAQQALTMPITAGRIRPQNGLTHSGASKYTMTSQDIGKLPLGEATPLNEVLLQMPGGCARSEPGDSRPGRARGNPVPDERNPAAVRYEYRPNVHPVAQLLFRAKR
jgi:hypothetical protein